MRFPHAITFFAASVLAPAASVAEPISPEDAGAIRAVIDRQTDAWNQHDMNAFVADTTPG